MKPNLTTLLLIFLFLSMTSTAVAGSTWYVNGVTGSDRNNCMSSKTACKTIGHAISLAASGDSIMVAAATYTENLTIGISLNVVGSGASTTIIDGGGVGTVITIPITGARVTLSRMTIRNGHAVYGGGINNSGVLMLSRSIVSANTGLDGGGLGNSGTATINNSIITSNTTSISCPAKGCALGAGGIENGGTMIISNSTVSGNFAIIFRCPFGGCSTEGGGIKNFGTLRISKSTVSGNTASAPNTFENPSRSFGGGIGNGGTMIISNSTITGNSARGNITVGGGISNSAMLTINNSTLSGNSASGFGHGGGIYNGSAARLKNSIIANSPLGGSCSGTVTSNGYNLSSDGTCNFNGPGDLNNTDPQLGPLQFNGGPTQTMALPSGSPAVDAGNPSGCTDNLGHLLKTDQRGAPRPDPEDAGGCDIGAYERQSD